MTTRRASGFNIPVLHALALQLCVLPLVAGLLFLLRKLAGIEVGIVWAALLQGALAAAAARMRGLSSWWLPLQCLLPPAIVFALALQLPAWVFLAAFFALLGIYWATLFTRVPLYLSSSALRQAVANLLPANHPVEFVDIGSGLGGVVIHLARLRPDCRFTGIELAPLPWLVSRIRTGLLRSSARILHGDYNKMDLSRFDVVFAYLSPLVMDEVWKKARREMRPGTLLLSCEFPVIGAEPDIVLQPASGRARLFGWKM